MKGKKLVVLIAAIFGIVSFAGVALAVDRVEVNILSEPIQKNAACDKAGGISLEFDAGTVIRHGDQFTIDLDYGVTLCNNIDIVLSPIPGANLDGSTPGSGWECTGVGGETIPLRSEGPRLPSPVSYNEDSPQLGAVNITTFGGGVFFHIYGGKGSQRVTLDVIGYTPDGGATRGSLTLGDDPDDKLLVSFFDQTTNPGVVSPYDHFVTPGIYIQGATAGIFDLDAQVVNNTYCINVVGFEPNTVNVNIDTKNDKYFVDPSNPQVAHIVSPLDIDFFACKGAKCGNIEIGAAASQQAGTCVFFDNEDGSGYCPGTHLNNKVVIQNKTGVFDASMNYQIQLDVLVNGKTGDNGVYFSAAAVGVGNYATWDVNSCAFATNAAGIVGLTNYRLANGNVATPLAAPSCTVPTTARAVSVITDSSALFAAGTKYLYIDIPSFTYDLSLIKAGDVVTVQVSLLKTPCGTIFSKPACIGTFGCEVLTSYRSLLFPYFGVPLAAGGYFYNGIVITNVSSVDGNVVFFLYEEDGDKFRVETNQTVKANNVYQTTLSALVESGSAQAIAGSAGDGVPGNSKCYVVACTSFISDGFALIGNATTGESMGYLARYENQAGGNAAVNDRYQAICGTITTVVNP